ncbi:unnamed protein product [Prunus armeniaca]
MSVFEPIVPTLPNVNLVGYKWVFTRKRNEKNEIARLTEHSANGILVHQSTSTEKVLKRFGMDKAHPLSTLMVVRSLDTKKDPYRPKGDDEMVLGPEVPYLSAIGALLYLAQCIIPDIAFSVNLLARYSSALASRH